MENENISHIQCCFEWDPGKILHLNEPGNLKTIIQNIKINFKEVNNNIFTILRRKRDTSLIPFNSSSLTIKLNIKDKVENFF